MVLSLSSLSSVLGRERSGAYRGGAGFIALEPPGRPGTGFSVG
jgi:hypothetical protein